MSTMTFPSSMKRVRSTADIKDADDISSFSSNTPSVLSKTPSVLSEIETPGYLRLYQTPHHLPLPLPDPSPPESDVERFLHQLLLCRQDGFNVIFDVRAKPSKAYIPSQDGTALPLTQYFHVPAMQPLQRRIQLISRYFDRRIVVENPKGITIGDILYRITDSLNKVVSKDEYNAVPEDAQADIIEAYQRNCSATSNGIKLRELQEGLKRVDWLGKRTLFAGIQKDEAYISGRIPSHSERAETYIVEFSASSR